MIPIPISVGDAINLYPIAKKWFEQRKRKRFLSAWQQIPLSDIYTNLCQYYESRGVSLFVYPSTINDSKPVPLYVKPLWVNLREDSLKC
jgi:hypothetical protein